VPGGFEWALVRIMEDAKKHQDVILMQDASCLVIYDAYPKARFHLLVLPKEKVMSISELRSHHLPLLRHLHRVAMHVVSCIRKQAGAGNCEGFRVGYHSVPSLKLLHLHIISADFDSACLKNKKHWNSFQPPFFLDSVHVQERLAAQGKVEVDRQGAEAMLKAPLTSHRTSEVLKNIPTLKEHLTDSRQPVSTGVLY
jgi:aprataxin